MTDEISKGFFWIPDFRHVNIWQALRLSLYVSKYGIVARKFAPPANLPEKGPAEEVGESIQFSKFGKTK
jgi:hypothetical protein